MRIGAESIYRWIYAAAQVGDTSYRHLRRAHRHCRRQTRYGRSRRMFPGRIDTSRHPQVVAGRSRFGDWEADLVCASRGKATPVSCNEGKSRFLVLARVENKTTAASHEALVPVCARAIPFPGHPFSPHSGYDYSLTSGAASRSRWASMRSRSALSSLYSCSARWTAPSRCRCSSATLPRSFSSRIRRPGAPKRLLAR